MTVMLPPDLADLLYQAGGKWPETDEDGVLTVAEGWRQMSTKLAAIQADGARLASNITAENQGQAIDAFSQYWSELDGHFETAITAASRTAGVLDGVAAATRDTKNGIISVLEKGKATIAKAEQASAVPVVGPILGGAARALLPIIGRALVQLVKLLWRLLVWLAKMIWKGLVWLWKKIVELFKKIFKKEEKKPDKPKHQELKDDFDKLEKGSGPQVKTVKTEKELRDLFDKWKEDADKQPPRNDKIPEVYKLDDGTVIQWRTTSKSGGATIDIYPPGGGKPMKVHIK